MPHREDRFIPDYDELKEVVETLRKLGCKIVLTQGAFDILHMGHVRYIEEARARGDVLILGVDSDALTRQRKGPNRPVVPEEERIFMLLGLRSVDIVTLRTNGEYLEDLVELIRPDVLVTSKTTADVTDAIRGKLSPFCGEIVTLEPQAEVNTTKRIAKLAIDGAGELAEKVSKVIQDHMRGKNGGS
jgi:D-beta-D-heptose 7-phosphate kinase/D-beta-D-heptose 1-phosphate adenosyltransferase